MTDEAPIPSSPIEALATVAVIPETDVAQAEGRMEAAKGKKDETRVSAREQAEKRGEDALKKEFPDLFQNGASEQPEATSTKADASGSKEPKSVPSKEAEADPTPRQDRRAVDILRRVGLSQERIDAMPVKERVALSKELKPKLLEQQHEVQQQRDPTFRGGQTIASNGKNGSQAGEPPDTHSSAFAEAVEALKRDSSPEFAANLEKLFEAGVAPLRAQLGEAKAALQKRKDEAIIKSISEAREALTDRFRELGDDDIFHEDVAPFIAGLAQTGRFNLEDPKDVHRLVAKAARDADLDEVTPQAKAEDEQVARLTRNGAASSRSKSTPYAGKTRDEKIALAAKLAQDPSISIEDARRRVHGS